MKEGTIGIIGAMDVETDGLKALISNPREETFGKITFVSGKLFGHDVVVAKSGVGKVFSAMCAQTMILQYAPAYIINTGIAGALNKSLGVLDIVIADKVVQHDFDLSSIGCPLGLLPGFNKAFLECDDELCTRLFEAASGFGKKVVRGIVATGDTFVADSEKNEHLRSFFGADACEMEGGSIGQVCAWNGVPFCVLRTMSDGGNEDSTLDYGKFEKLAAVQSIAVMGAFLKAL